MQWPLRRNRYDTQRRLRTERRAWFVVRDAVVGECPRTTTSPQIGNPMSSRNARFDLPPTSGSVRVARHVVVELMRVWGVPHDHEDAALLVTELVTNVVDHVEGEAELTVEVSAGEDWLRIAVVDGSAVRPVVRELSMDHPRGRGMRMIQQIADRWGAEDHLGGKRVWCELRPPGM